MGHVPKVRHRKERQPPMPDGDVTPEGCERAHWRLSSSDQRPHHKIPASLPKDQTPVEPREGLDPEAYPPLPQSEGVGVGGVQGYDKNPKNLPLGVPAKKRTETGSRPAEATRPPMVTTPKPLEEPHEAGMEKSRKDPVVQLQRLPKELDIAHQTLSRRSGPSTTATRTAAAATGSPEIEAMEVEAPPARPSPPRPHRPGSRKSSEQPPRGEIPEEIQDNMDDQQSRRTSPKQDRSTRRAAPPGPSPSRGSGAGLHDPHAPARAIAAAHLDTIRQGGGLPPPGPHLGAVPREDWNIPKRGDWTREPFPPMEWKVPPPSGISLATLPPEQPESWKPWTGISQSELFAYLERIAQGGQRDANHEHYQRFARFRQDTLDALQRFKNNLRAL